MAKRLKLKNLLVIIIAFISGRYFLRSRLHSRKLDKIDQAFADKLPKFSTLARGDKADPNNLLLVGDAADIEAAFAAAGWFVADEPSFWRLLRSLGALILNYGYRKGPVTPFFIHGRVQDWSFQKPTHGRSFRHRHHVRVWDTGYVYRDKPVWLAAAIYDNGVRFTYKPPFITHSIAPNLDTERDYVVSDLGIRHTAELHFGPDEGHNAFGNAFYTDGMIKVLEIG